MVGFNTPEDTLQSFLWALQNHNLTNLLQALTADKSEQLQAALTQSGSSADDFFQNSAVLVGLRIVERKESAGEDHLDLKVEMIPGVPPQTIRFQQTNGQWRIAGPF